MKHHPSRGIVLYQHPIVWIVVIVFVLGALAVSCFVLDQRIPFICPQKNGSSGDVRNIEPSWSPDGSRIAFASNREGNWELYLVIVDTLETSRVTSNEAVDRRPAWTPGGDQLAFVSNRDGQRCFDIYTIHPETKKVTRVTFRPQGCDDNPSWTPTTVPGEISKRIAFDSDRDDGKGEIYVLDVRTFAVTRVTFREATPDLNPTISPDGSRIAFQSYVNGNWEIFVMESDGTNVKQLTFNPADDIDPAWSPDGQRIAFATNRDGNWEIYTMDVDGGNVKNLTNSGTHERWPTWSPNGEEIAFQSDRTGRWEIWKMRSADGTEQKQLTGLE